MKGHFSVRSGRRTTKKKKHFVQNWHLQVRAMVFAFPINSQLFTKHLKKKKKKKGKKKSINTVNIDLFMLK